MGTESEYERYEEPYSYEVRDRRVRGARGLQAVDGLTTSAVFDDAAERYVAGGISARQLSDIVDDYYNQKVERGINRYSQEADLVSARICDALDSNGFTFSPATLRAIHGRLFRGLMEHPFYEQHYRDYNISKREFVLARESVAYGDYASLEADLETAFSEFSPAPAQGGDYTAYIASVADFIARIWQIHPFAEGNTRTVAVFLQQLLHFHGFPKTAARPSTARLRSSATRSGGPTTATSRSASSPIRRSCASSSAALSRAVPSPTATATWPPPSCFAPRASSLRKRKTHDDLGKLGEGMVEHQIIGRSTARLSAL